MSLGVRTWGNSPDGATVTLTGTYQMDGEVSGRLRRALPPLLVMRREEWNSPLIPLLASEVAVDDPGQEAVLDRLLDLLLIAVLRAWFARPEAEAPGWYRAYADPVVGPALRLMHNAPGAPVERGRARPGERRVAGGAGAALHRARRPATDTVPGRVAHRAGRRPAARAGSDHRLGRAPGRLRQPLALSAAFKRLRGVSPQEFRAAAAA
jgi:hypothetical protein